MSNHETEKEKIVTEVYRLAQAALIGELSQIEREQLEQLVIQNDTARNAYLSFILDTAVLKDFASADALNSTFSQSSCTLEPEALSNPILPDIISDLLTGGNAQSTPTSFLPQLSSWMPVLAAFFIGIFSFYFVAVFLRGTGPDKINERNNNDLITSTRDPQRSTERPVIDREGFEEAGPTNALGKSEVAASFPVAYLASVQGCEWGNTSRSQWSIGQPVRQGDEISLQEGIAEFRLAYNGISLSVEGPANLVMTSSRSLILPQGKMTVLVPPVVGDLKLMAGGCRITTADSEVGIQVVNNRTCIHVFSGKATVIPSPFVDRHGSDADDLDDKNTLTPIELARGDAVEIKTESSGDIAINRTAADQEQFAAKLSMAGKLPVTDKYIKAVKASKPAGYWRFEAVEENKTIRNEVRGGSALNVTAEFSLIGDRDNHVVDLGNSFKPGNLVSDQPIGTLLKENFSIELWAKPSHYHRGFLLAFATLAPKSFPIPSVFQNDLVGALPEKNSFRLELRRDYGVSNPGTVVCVTRNPIATYSKSCVSNELYRVRRWQHIVVVRGRAGMFIYLDGKVVAQDKNAKKMVPNTHLVVGRPFPSFNDFPFVGQVDELSIYDHVLTSEEVMKHYRAIEDSSHPDPEI